MGSNKQYFGRRSVSLTWLAAVLVAVPAVQAELVTNADCSSFAGWSQNDWGNYYAYTDSGGDSIFSWGWWGDQRVWQDTGTVFEANTVYNLNVRARKGDPNAVGIQLELYDVTNNWAILAAQPYDFTLSTSGDNEPWETFNLALDTGLNPDLVGHTIGVGVRQRNEGGFGWIQVDNISLLPGGVAGATTVYVDPLNAQQRFDYWATSLSWWANGIGDWQNDAKRELLLDLCFDKSFGLGLNMVRYHIGGGEDPASAIWFRPGAKMPGFQPAPGVWDWDADPYQRLMLKGALARGVERVDAFSCSPPWWMTISGSVTGAVGGGNNLQTSMYDDFAEYLAEVTRFYRDTHGVEFTMISPINEPDAFWWEYGGWQEGCHFSPSRQNQLVKELGPRLEAKGLKTRISVAEEWGVSNTLNTLPAYDSTALSYIGQINMHTYGGGDFEALARWAESRGLPLLMSEYGDGTTSNFEAMFVTAQRIAEDINAMRVNGWTIWALISATSIGDAAIRWCMILANFNGSESFLVYPKYYGFKQFTANVQPGSYILNPGAGNEDLMLVGLHPRSGQLAIVAINPTTAASNMAYDLSALPYPIASADRVRTSATQRYALLSPLDISNDLLVDTLPGKSITTYTMNAFADPQQRWLAMTADESRATSNVEMTEIEADSGVHARMMAFNSPPTSPAMWRVEHAILPGLGQPTETIDAWYQHDSVSTLDLYFDENEYDDGWLPRENLLYQEPPYVASEYVIVGTFQSEIGDPGDWHANSTQTMLRDDGQAGDAVAGDGIYTLRLTIPTPKNYLMIALADRDWNTRLTAIGPIRAPHHSFEFMTTTANQTVTFHCDINLNRIKATPRISQDFAGIMAALSGPGVLPSIDGSTSSQDLLNRYDMDDDNDIDSADLAAYVLLP